jgi:hypothetical protein
MGLLMELLMGLLLGLLMEATDRAAGGLLMGSY